MDESRRKTLETLIALAEDSNPSSCWDDRRAEDLLRSQSSPAELRELGASEKTIEHIFSQPRPEARGPRTGEDVVDRLFARTELPQLGR